METSVISTQEVNEYLKSHGCFDNTGVYHMTVNALQGLGFAPHFETKIGTYWNAEKLPEMLGAVQEALPKKADKRKAKTPSNVSSRLDAIEKKLDFLVSVFNEGEAA